MNKGFLSFHNIFECLVLMSFLTIYAIIHWQSSPLQHLNLILHSTFATRLLRFGDQCCPTQPKLNLKPTSNYISELWCWWIYSVKLGAGFDPHTKLIKASEELKCCKILVHFLEHFYSTFCFFLELDRCGQYELSLYGRRCVMKTTTTKKTHFCCTEKCWREEHKGE